MTTPSHRQLVVHAKIKNNKGEVSQRFVDHQVFKLWQRLMIHQHDFSVLSAKPCVWIPAEESRRNDQLFAHTQFQQNVSRLTFECYNQELGITKKNCGLGPIMTFKLTQTWCCNT